MPTLNKFLDWVKQGKIRDNVEQSAGWLILIGAEEDDNKNFTPGYGKYPDLLGWKVGSYEPCLPEEHGDIRYLYTVNLTDKTITYVDR